MKKKTQWAVNNSKEVKSKPLTSNKDQPKTKVGISENPDSVFLVRQRAGEIPTLDEFRINNQLSDLYFDERNILPENRLAFVKRMVHQQNASWQELTNRADEFLIRNNNVNQILNITVVRLKPKLSKNVPAFPLRALFFDSQKTTPLFFENNFNCTILILGFLLGLSGQMMAIKLV